MTNEDMIKQHMLRLEHPEVDWSVREGETQEQAIARWRIEIKKWPKRSKWSTLADLLEVPLAAIAIAAGTILAIAAIGAGFAIARALWRLAGQI
jgi:hypothetical protein